MVCQHEAVYLSFMYTDVSNAGSHPNSTAKSSDTKRNQCFGNWHPMWTTTLSVYFIYHAHLINLSDPNVYPENQTVKQVELRLLAHATLTVCTISLSCLSGLSGTFNHVALQAGSLTCHMSSWDALEGLGSHEVRIGGLRMMVAGTQ